MKVYTLLIAYNLYSAVVVLKVVKLTRRADELLVKSIGHQWLREAPSEG